SQWEIYLSYLHQVGYNGKVPTNAQGKEIAPLGYNVKGQQVFTVLEEKGEPILKVSGEVYGCVFTKQEYQNYHLKLKYKWGEKKFDPRKDLLKDSGVLYHSIGKAGVDYWRAWMLSQEFQIMEGHTGDYWSIANSAMDVRAFIPEPPMVNAVASLQQPFIGFGTGTGRDGFCLRTEDRESKNNDWTEIELICFGDKSLHIVNGQVVMVLQNSRYVENGKSLPLTKGKIQIQSEAAETYFKDIMIKPISALPKEYANYF
ncbi:MAG: 3-keto-disaccharide hydrolase, partial [Rufibacter sp.]